MSATAFLLKQRPQALCFKLFDNGHATEVGVQIAEYPMRAGSPEREGAVIRVTALRDSAARRLGWGEQGRINASREGNREAFDGLVASHQNEIRKFIAKRVPKENVDDLLQEIWLAAWSSMADFDGRSRFRTWIYGIAINKCKTFYRSQQRKVVHLSIDQGLNLPAPSPTRGSDLEALIPSLIEQLGETHKQLLDLYYYGELTLPEIARLLDRNLNTVKYQFYRAHTELANLVKEVGRA